MEVSLPMVYPADFLMVEGVGEITAVEPGEAGEKVWDREQMKSFSVEQRRKLERLGAILIV